MRVRNALAYATHSFFQSEGFMYVHTPLITGSDCEGAGEMFQVTTLDLSKPLPQAPGGESSGPRTLRTALWPLAASAHGWSPPASARWRRGLR